MPNITTREKCGIVSWANPPKCVHPMGPSWAHAQLPLMSLFPVLTSVSPPTVTWRVLPVSFLSLGLGEVEGGQGHEAFCFASQVVQSLLQSAKEGCTAHRFWALTKCPWGGSCVRRLPCCSPVLSLLSLSLPWRCRVDVGTISPSWACTMAACLLETQY